MDTSQSSEISSPYGNSISRRVFLRLVGSGVGGAAVTCSGLDVLSKSVDTALFPIGAGRKWTIGNSMLEMTFEWTNGNFILSSFQNKLHKSAVEYVDCKTAIAPFSLSSGHIVETIWSKNLISESSVDLAKENVRLRVSKGCLIGFRVGPCGDWQNDHIHWINEVCYDDGERFVSLEDSGLSQGPRWYYYMHQRGTGFMEQMDSIWGVPEGIARGPSMDSGATAQRGLAELLSQTPRIDLNSLFPSPDFDALRVWKAPKDGIVTIKGLAERRESKGTLAIVRFNERATTGLETGWNMVSSKTDRLMHHGRPVTQLTIVLQRGPLEARLQLVVFPGNPLVKQSITLANVGSSAIEVPLVSPAPLVLSIKDDGISSYSTFWLVGGNNQSNAGQLEQETVSASYQKLLGGAATWGFIPWMALQREKKERDGLFIALEYIGRWKLMLDRQPQGAGRLAACVADFKAVHLNPADVLKLPEVYLGVFRDNLDNMSRSLYSWQYEYMWDYTSNDYYAKPACSIGGSGDSCLQERWAGLVSGRGCDWTDYIRTMGFEMLWYDAVWGAPRDWWQNNLEGPDFARINRFLEKHEMKLVIWIPGHQELGLLNTKVGSWGNFQRREDGMGQTPACQLPLSLVPWSIGFDPTLDPTYHQEIEAFLTSNPCSSMHTCSGGSTYAHTFGTQRVAGVNYDQDPPGSEILHHYWSYLETPDKWLDALCCGSWWKNDKYGRARVYDPSIAKRLLASVPHWGAYVTTEDMEHLRIILDTYRYLRHIGVVGRWSYVSHPTVIGDEEYHYCQRISHDRQKSIVILKHKSLKPVIIYPRELLPEHNYFVEYDSAPQAGRWRSGTDLMKHGIEISNQKPGELIYLNVPNRPGSGRDNQSPEQPGKAFARLENNVGQLGVGIYWSSGYDTNWLSYYEVQRNGLMLGKASKGNYYFDRSVGWNPAATYTVRSIDGDGNASAWTRAENIKNEAYRISVLGAHFSEQGREGWRAEVTSDKKTYRLMNWEEPHLNEPHLKDLGGTSLHPTGAEGYWAEIGGGRIGRGWQRASTNAMCVRSWTTLYSGDIRVVGRAFKDNYFQHNGGPLRICIQLENNVVWPSTGWATINPADLFGVSHDLRINVKAGDVLRFILDRGNDPNTDTIVWMPEIIFCENTVRTDNATVMRIACGSSRSYVDKLGHEWSKDKYFSGGDAIMSKIAVTRPGGGMDDERLYQCAREGADFKYSIPVAKGVYSMRLKWVEPVLNCFERPFNVDVNGKQVLSNFDICQAARGQGRIYHKVIHYIVPNGNGQIVIRFKNGWEPIRRQGNALIQAIEVLPEFNKPTIRINVGSDVDFIDSNSFVWNADVNYEGGSAMTSDALVEQASPTFYDQGLYRTCRIGKVINYNFSVPPGFYTVHLKFAELWLKDLGRRPMNIQINGYPIRKSWDPATASGKIGRAAEVRVEDIVPDNNGQIVLRIAACGANNAILQGVEIE